LFKRGKVKKRSDRIWLLQGKVLIVTHFEEKKQGVYGSIGEKIQTDSVHRKPGDAECCSASEPGKGIRCLLPEHGERVWANLRITCFTSKGKKERDLMIHPVLVEGARRDDSKSGRKERGWLRSA